MRLLCLDRNCMKNKVSFKEFCFYARKNAADFKAELEQLINHSKKPDSVEEESKENEGNNSLDLASEQPNDTDLAEKMKEWAESKKDLSFADLKTNDRRYG